MKRPKVHRASIAFACDGSVVANVHGFAGETDPQELLGRALDLGGEVFIGVRLHGREIRETLSRIEDASHEGAGAAFVDRERRRMKTAGKSTKQTRR